MKKFKSMKALVLAMTMALVMIAGNLKAQYDENAFGIQPWYGESSLLNKEGPTMRDGETESPSLLSLPSIHGGSDDVEAPLGSGIAVLVGLGAAYLIGKKRSEE